MQFLALREKRFIRYLAIGVSTFALDLALLWFFTDVLKIQYLVATAYAFLFAVSLNYAISRTWVFRHSDRTMVRGYVYFIQFALLGAAITALLMWVLTTYTNLGFVVARVLIAGVVGIGNYLTNLYINFKVAGKELD